MEVDQTREINHANVFTTNNEEFEEYEEVESCTEGVGEDEQTTIPEDQLARCRFCWGTSASFENPSLNLVIVLAQLAISTLVV